MNDLQRIVEQPVLAVGATYGSWTVAGDPFKQGRSYRVPCVCVCGAAGKPWKHALVSGDSTSCGCQRSALKRNCKRFHGLSQSPEYLSWKSMIQRCTNPQATGYERYGGVGIKVCARWMDFKNFLADMGPRPSPDHSIDRFPNKGGDYEPGNCRWATTLEQNRNQKTNTLLTHNGVTKVLPEWAEELGITPETMRMRIASGMPEDRVFTAGRLR